MRRSTVMVRMKSRIDSKSLETKQMLFILVNCCVPYVLIITREKPHLYFVLVFCLSSQVIGKSKLPIFSCTWRITIAYGLEVCSFISFGLVMDWSFSWMNKYIIYEGRRRKKEKDGFLTNPIRRRNLWISHIDRDVYVDILVWLDYCVCEYQLYWFGSN